MLTGTGGWGVPEAIFPYALIKFAQFFNFAIFAFFSLSCPPFPEVRQVSLTLVPTLYVRFYGESSITVPITIVGLCGVSLVSVPISGLILCTQHDFGPDNCLLPYCIFANLSLDFYPYKIVHFALGGKDACTEWCRTKQPYGRDAYKAG